MRELNYITNPNELKDITGFEKYLWENGYELKASSDYFNTYSGCSRAWSKNESTIYVGLIDKPTRIGITHPTVAMIKEVDNGVEFSLDMKYTYLPEPNQYKEFEDKLKKS
jgi:hypothetical protein